MGQSPPTAADSQRRRLPEVALLFLRLGFTAFGGPAVHVAMMEDEVVKRRKWIDRQQFLDLVAAVNFIPGPNSTELAIHLGLIRAGFAGLITAGFCFIVPAVLIILPIAWAYTHYGTLPTVTAPLAGIRAAMIAIIAAAMLRFARTGVKDRFGIAIALIVTVLALKTQTTLLGTQYPVPQSELILLAASALAGAIFYASKSPPPTPTTPGPSEAEHPTDAPRSAAPDAGLHPPTAILPFLAATSLPLSSKLLSLTLFFLKVGATLFGSGYVLVSYLRAGVVRPDWLTPDQLTDAIAVGQVTPGPLLTTATFIGYILGYHWSGHDPRYALLGALLATTAIFLPSFLFVSLLGPLWPKLRRSRLARGALDGMNAAVVALILVVSLGLAHESLRSIPAALIAAAALTVILIWDLNSTWIVLEAAILGFLMLR